MTKLTIDMRDAIERSILKSLPSINYPAMVQAAVQAGIVEHMTHEVRAVYMNSETRKLLAVAGLRITTGNKSMRMYTGNVYYNDVIGVGSREFTIRVDEASYVARPLTEGTLLHTTLIKNGVRDMAEKYFAQDDLFDSVRQRVRANLRAATTIKRLYEIFEPELHHYIPKEGAKNMLPATVAPVVDDLRKLGLTLPDTPKAVA